MVALRLVEDAPPDGVLQRLAVEAPEGDLFPAVEAALPVSYTHLTLPTILRV